MKKLYAGLAAAALTATGIACTAGAANAEGAWPDQFSPAQIASVSGGTYVLGSYDTGQKADDGSGGTYDLTATAIVKVVGTSVTPIDLGANADPTAVTSHGDTVYVVGSDDQTGDAELWTISADGTLDSATLPHSSSPQTVAVSANGNRLAVAGWENVTVMNTDDLTPTATMPASDFYGTADIAFSPDGDTLQIAANDSDDTNVDLWSLSSDAGSVGVGVPVTVQPTDDMPTGVVVASDGTTYVATTGGDSELIAVKGTDITTQAAGSAQGLALSADGSTAYVAADNGIAAFATDALGTYGDNPNPSYFAGDDEVNAVTLDAAGDVVIAESQSTWDDSTETNSVSNQAVDVVTAPGAPSHVTASRGDTWAEVSFSAATSTGSSVWTSTDPNAEETSITYTITLHDTTNPARPDIVDANRFDPSDALIGEDDDPGKRLVPGDAYTVSVTTTNGLFDSTAATYSLAAYKAPVGGHTPSPTTQPTHQATQQPAHVTKIKAAKIKSSSKKLKLTLPGVTTAPGKVKVFDGKKLIGKAKIKNGKLVLKLKKKLHKGKHKITLKYAGSAKVAKFHKSVKVKVK